MTHSYPVSFAAVFNRAEETEPICSACFFAEAATKDQAHAIEEYISKTLVPKLAYSIPTVDKADLSAAITSETKRVTEIFGVSCWGQLADLHFQVSTTER